MPLPAYGVVIGQYQRSGTHQGQWLHELLYVQGGGQLYEVSVDVNEPNGIFQYQIIGRLDRGLFGPILALSDGYHGLARDATSGAIDYLRSPFVQRAEGCLTLVVGFLNALLHRNDPVWTSVTGDEAGNALVQLVTGSSRVYAFGAPYANPVPLPGLHDVHMNQGDPVDSMWHSTDGIWQDGCVIVEDAQGNLTGYFGKFATQSLHTDDNGYPA
jgi:hypothetical protein